MLDRLLRVLLIAVLRTWFARTGALRGVPRVWRSRRRQARGLIHDDTARQWTVGDLTAEGGVSRAACARRITELVGEPPRTFLTAWRLSFATDLLLEPDATIGSVAYQVGYATPYSLSTAFKRVRGISPRRRRLAAAAS